jgi:uncharacterized protein YbjT (DUF2867 family)
VRDIAAVAVKALTEPNHEGKAYTLTGPEALTYDELASELSKVLGRSISHISLSPSDLKNGMLAEGMPEEIADRMLAWSVTIARTRLAGSQTTSDK